MSKQIQCPACNGEGRFMEADRFADEYGDRDIVYIQCERCHGDGWIVIDEEVADDK